MGTKCKYNGGIQVFSGSPQMIAAAGNITSNQQIVSSITKTVLLTETIYGNTLNSTSMGFRAFIAGEISTAGSTTCTLVLRYGTTDILDLPIIFGVGGENDLPFKAEFTGHVLTTGASGVIVAHAYSSVFAAAPLYDNNDTANTGVSVDLTANGSLNITGQWSASSANDDIIVTHGWIELFS